MQKASTILGKQEHMCVNVDHRADGRAFRWEKLCGVDVPAAGDGNKRETAFGEGHEGYAGTWTPSILLQSLLNSDGNI